MNVFPRYPLKCCSCNKPISHIGMAIQRALEDGEQLEYLYQNVYTDLRFCCKSELMNPSPWNINTQNEEAVYRTPLNGQVPRPIPKPDPSCPRGYYKLVESNRFPGMFVHIDDGQGVEATYQPIESTEEEEFELPESGSELEVNLAGVGFVPTRPGVPVFGSVIQFTNNPKRIKDKIVPILDNRTYLAW